MITVEAFKNNDSNSMKQLNLIDDVNDLKDNADKGKFAFHRKKFRLGR